MSEANNPKLTLLMEQYESVHHDPGWVEFRKFRREWDQLVRRRRPQNLDAVAKAYGAAVDVESPDVEKALQDWVNALMIGETKIDALSMDSGTTAKKDVESIRIWTAGSLLQQNKSRRFDRERFEQMARWGVAVSRKTWEMPEEPGAPEQDADETDAAYAKRALSARDEQLADQKHPFGRVYVSPLQMSWFPIAAPEDIELYFQESSVPYVEARQIKNRQGESLRIDKKDAALFVGDGQPVDEASASDWRQKRVTLLVRAYLDKQKACWYVDEWVKDGAADVGDFVELDSYECPLGHAPYFVIEGGDTLTSESNPHLRYRPIIYPLIVDVQELNALSTLLVQLAIKKIRDEDVYVDISSLPDKAAGMLQEWGLIEEGSGAKKRLRFKRPEPGSGEIMAVPHLERWPNDIDQHLVMRIQMVQASIAEHKPNRFMLGQADQALAESPATSFLQQAEASGVPLSGYLRNTDEMTREWLLAEHRAMVRWDDQTDEGGTKEYVYRVQSDEPLSRSPRDPGDEVTVTAEILKRSYILKVLTRNETQGENALNVQLADVAYEKQSITESEWLKRRGSDDPEKQIEELWKDRQRKLADSELQPIYTQLYRNYLSAVSNLNLGLMLGDQGAGGAAGGGGTPPVSQETPPSGPPASAPTPQPVARTFATPGAVAGPSGGSSGSSFG